MATLSSLVSCVVYVTCTMYILSILVSCVVYVTCAMYIHATTYMDVKPASYVPLSMDKLKENVLFQTQPQFVSCKLLPT